MVEFEPHRRLPAIDDELDASAQVGEHVLRGRGRHVPGPVRRRRHQRATDRGQDGARDRVAGHAHGNGIEAGGGKLRHRAIGVPGQHQGQGAGPERFREPLGGMVEVRERARRGSVADVGNQRIERRAALGLIEASDRFCVGGVGAEPIDGLGGKGDEAAGSQHACGGLGRRVDRAILGRLRLDHAGCRWRSHRGYLCLRRRGDAVIRAAFWQAECSAVW